MRSQEILHVSANTSATPTTQVSYPGDYDGNIVAPWLQIELGRWIAGIFAGALAGLIAMALAMVVSASAGMEFWFPIKLMSTPILGTVGTDNRVMTGAIVGFIVWEAIAMFWGFVYSHFVSTRAFGGLLAMGLVWGIFLWVFNWNLYYQSFKPILWSATPSSAAILICVVYGLSLSSVGFFDRNFPP